MDELQLYVVLMKDSTRISDYEADLFTQVQFIWEMLRLEVRNEINDKQVKFTGCSEVILASGELCFVQSWDTDSPSSLWFLLCIFMLLRAVFSYAY